MTQNRSSSNTIMNFFAKFYDKKSLFRDEDKILNLAQVKSKQQKPKILKIFETSKQRTYLINDGSMVYCVLDDVRNNQPKLVWKTPRNAFLRHGKLNVKLNPRDKTKNTGVIDLGNQHKNWLYSKRLIKPEELKDSFSKFIS
ncbi:hypothetical protein HJP15_18995 [Pseudoalteromonas sp. NEC-BIFX-2020_002]|uniref:hypothetical protein n=1 Tax=Pseudoalteromonas sp. NEC-BIFX-2020_002 TaxID=2732353 RepID=UPI0014776015|nr:hypothetical protein [Pseudoalteromonas sp. NEC-BIFX-2020_002]NNG44979.1 hypothetical protein [Pseudoalteromonas sp. NEC-BIFX-2020_002]